MDAVSRGGDRQELHERIRQHSIEAGKMVKEQGKPNDLLERIAADKEHFGLTREELALQTDPHKFTGRSEKQTEEFIAEYVQPVIDKYASSIKKEVPELKV